MLVDLSDETKTNFMPLIVHFQIKHIFSCISKITVISHEFDLETCYGALPSCYKLDLASEFSFPCFSSRIGLLQNLLYIHTRETRGRGRERERGALHTCHWFFEQLTSNGLKLLKYSGWAQGPLMCQYKIAHPIMGENNTIKDILVHNILLYRVCQNCSTIFDFSHVLIR